MKNVLKNLVTIAAVAATPFVFAKLNSERIVDTMRSCGHLEVGTNHVHIFKYSGLIDTYYSFYDGTNQLTTVDGWDGTSGSFKLEDNLVSFDKWSGPYKIVKDTAKFVNLNN